MDFMTLAKERYSCRSFDSSKKISDEDIKQILEAARIAPSAVNAGRGRIRVVKSEEGLSKIRQSANCHYNAPVVLILTYVREMKGFGMKVPEQIENKMGLLDAGIAATHIALRAKDLGLDSCITASFNEELMRKDFNISNAEEISVVIPIGYATNDKKGSVSKQHEMRITMDEMVVEI